MAKLLKGKNIIPIILVGAVVIILADHFVLKGKLGIAGHFNKLLGHLKKMGGIGAGPIEPATPTPEVAADLEGGPMSPEEAEEQFAEDMAIEREHMARYPD